MGGRRSDPYETLNLTHDASLDDIKRSYRELARKYHPDRLVQHTEEEQQAAAAQFATISDAYALLTDSQRKARYDHIYKYGGYDDSEDDGEEKKEDGAPSPSSSRKRRATGVGYACADPLAFLWSNGRVQSKMAVAGIQIPSRIATGNGIRFAFSSGHFSTSPTGTKRYTTQTTQFSHGKKVTKTQTTVVHPDGRKEVVIEGNDFVERRFVPAPAGGDGECMDQTTNHPQPWYHNVWHGLKDKFTMCYSPCAVAQ